MARAVYKFLIKNFKRPPQSLLIGCCFELTVARIAAFSRFFDPMKHFDVLKNFAEFDGRTDRV
ncbi:MAG: hypothetical protein CMM01_07135 [Rhodopirellula sp.]|nr:hypothetical protein [Rhodopirellula sp.]